MDLRPSWGRAEQPARPSADDLAQAWFEKQERELAAVSRGRVWRSRLWRARHLLAPVGLVGAVLALGNLVRVAVAAGAPMMWLVPLLAAVVVGRQWARSRHPREVALVGAAAVIYLAAVAFGA